MPCNTHGPIRISGYDENFTCLAGYDEMKFASHNLSASKVVGVGARLFGELNVSSAQPSRENECYLMFTL